MTSIPAAICRVYRNIWKRQYLINKRPSLDFLLPFWNVHEIWSNIKKKDEYPRLIISEIFDAEKRGYLNVEKVFLKNTIR